MGSWFSFLLYGKKTYTLLIVGPEDCGKTSLLYKWNGSETKIVPTVGFNVENAYERNHIYTIFDIGGKFRRFWNTYYENTDFIIYVVDACKIETLQESRKILNKLLKNPKLVSVPLVVLSNKQDLKGALDSSFVKHALNLLSIKDRRWNIFNTSVKTGAGLNEMYDWIYNVLEYS